MMTPSNAHMTQAVDVRPTTMLNWWQLSHLHKLETEKEEPMYTDEKGMQAALVALCCLMRANLASNSADLATLASSMSKQITLSPTATTEELFELMSDLLDNNLPDEDTPLRELEMCYGIAKYMICEEYIHARGTKLLFISDVCAVSGRNKKDSEIFINELLKEAQEDAVARVTRDTHRQPH